MRLSHAAGFLFAALASAWISHAQPAAKAGAPAARVLLVTGIDYPGHLWKQTAPVLKQALERDPRLSVRVVEDPNFLDSAALTNYAVIILHWMNWEVPGPGPAVRANLQRFLRNGGGLVLTHFACGAWHNEWPEFANLAGRVWFGSNPGPGKRQHDPYGPFRVEFPHPSHPITLGLSPFETRDELYTCLTGNHPIEVIAQTRSSLDGQVYPIALISHYGAGRTFLCTLGHDVNALNIPAVQELYRRGCAWAAGLPPM